MKRKNRVMGVLLILTGIGTMLYWVNYFAAGDVRVVPERWYVAFEDSFPLADSWMAIMAVVAGIGLWRGAAWGAPAGLLAGSALIFLAAMDITFNIENGLYALAATSQPMQFEIAINLWTLVFGLATVLACWRSTER